MPLIIPPVVAWTLAALGAVAVVRLAMRHSRRVNDDLDAMRATKSAEAVDRDKMPRLRRDPVTGEYRPD